ncbi:MAG: zf-HC2 domain-containing protein, partial [candidate division NC10 bacterium]|nr:zf-HC2 domain-containing protein [candidate division NC10 bacterium]
MVSELREREPHVTGERLGAFADGELEPVEAEAVRRHLAACPACRSGADVLGRAGALLREAVAAEPAPAPEVVWRAVRARMEAEIPAGIRVPARRRLSPPAWLALPRSLVWTAAALVLIAGLTLRQTRGGGTPAPGPPALPSPSLA